MGRGFYYNVESCFHHSAPSLDTVIQTISNIIVRHIIVFITKDEWIKFDLIRYVIFVTLILSFLIFILIL